MSMAPLAHEQLVCLELSVCSKSQSASTNAVPPERLRSGAVSYTSLSLLSSFACSAHHGRHSPRRHHLCSGCTQRSFPLKGGLCLVRPRFASPLPPARRDPGFDLYSQLSALFASQGPDRRAPRSCLRRYSRLRPPHGRAACLRRSGTTLWCHPPLRRRHAAPLRECCQVRGDVAAQRVGEAVSGSGLSLRLTVRPFLFLPPLARLPLHVPARLIEPGCCVIEEQNCDTGVLGGGGRFEHFDPEREG